MKKYVLGLDVGGVIIKRHGPGADTMFADNFLEAPPTQENLLELLGSLTPEFDETVIISKCGQRVRERTLAWMEHHNFHDITGIPVEKVHFCRKRSDKAGIAKDLGVNYFVDDRLEILVSMRDIVDNLYAFCPEWDEVLSYRKPDKYYQVEDIHFVQTWDFLEMKLRLMLLYDKVAESGRAPDFLRAITDFRTDAV